MTQQDGLFPPPSTGDITTLAKVHELEREIGMRNNVYPRWYDQGKLSQQEGERRILVLQAMLEDYNQLLKVEAISDAEDLIESGTLPESIGGRYGRQAEK